MTRPQVYQSQTTPCRALCEMRSGVMQCSAELLPTIHDANANGAYALLVGQHCGTGTAREMERACACPQALRSIGVASDHHLVSPGQTACACSLTSQHCPYLQVGYASRGVRSRSGVLWHSMWSVQESGLPVRPAILCLPGSRSPSPSPSKCERDRCAAGARPSASSSSRCSARRTRLAVRTPRATASAITSRPRTDPAAVCAARGPGLGIIRQAHSDLT